MRKFFRNAGKLVLSLIIGLMLAGFLPAKAQADGSKPVDLELGGEGATHWDIADIQPADSGIKTVELHNAGSKDGFVTIWLSDVISGEGFNPESETGDKAEPGEFADHMLLNLSANGLSTNLNLPLTVNTFPQSAAGPEYVEVIPVRSGATVDIQWGWEMPAQTGNEIQGDNISFTINYLLRECKITEVSGVVTGEGVFTEEVVVESESGKGKVVVENNTAGHTKEGAPLSEMWLIEMDKEPPAPPSDKAIVGFNYDAGPDGATFDRPITITFTYNPDDISQGVDERDLVIALWDKNAGEWDELEDCTVDTVSHTISALIDHFSRYTIIAPVSPPPPNHPFPEPVARVRGPSLPIGEEGAPTATGLLAISMLDQESIIEIGADGILGEALTLADHNGNFVIDVDSGTRVTGSGAEPLSRIELSITDEPIVVSENIVVLSPVYRLTGYTRAMGATGIDFYPPARLTIRYDRRNLPENAFLPFVANYTDEQGLVRLQPSPDSLVEIGKAKALVSHASLFVVAVEVAPPPPPLPARFEASDLIISPKRAHTGEPVTISLTITNEGATAGTYELHLIIDGIVRAIEEVTLTGNSSETLTFEVSNLAAGSHQVKVAGLTGRFEVTMVSVLPVEAGVNWLVLDTSVGAVLFIGLLVLYLVVRRSRRTRLGRYNPE